MSVRLAPPPAALAILLAVWQAPASAADAGYEAFQNKDYAAAIEHWMPGAKAGQAARLQSPVSTTPAAARASTSAAL